MTAKEWKENNPRKAGNIRDYASINELICLSNMENIYAVLIEDGVEQKERLLKLNQITLVVDEISLETGEDSMTILPKFIASKTAETLYDESSKLWWNGPAYIAEMYLAEKNK
jgi:hypothetical protein